MRGQRGLPLPLGSPISRPAAALLPLQSIQAKPHDYPLTISTLPHQFVAVVADLHSSKKLKQASS